MKRDAVLYVRVSSKEQEREGFSIPAQKKFLNEYALNNNLNVVKVFEESESAKSAGRPEFKRLLEFLHENLDVCHVLVEKTDRLYRNLKDYNRLDPTYWPYLKIHLAKENEVLSKESKSHQKLIHGIKVLMAKNYSDNLSEEVQKGMGQKAEQGLWTSNAPIGYLNNSNKHIIEPDPEKSPLILRAYEMAKTGQYSLNKLKKLLYREGFRGKRSGKELSKSQMQRILTNPIYYGDFVWKGIYYRGKHTPLINKSLFDDVQLAMGFAKRSKSTKYSFAYTNLMTCSHCGCSITAQEKRKKSGKTYIYYHCASGKSKCEGITYVREEKLESLIAEILGQIKVPDDIFEWSKEELSKSHKEEKLFYENQIRSLEQRYRTIKNKINKVYEDKLEGVIDSEFWVQQNERLSKELTEIQSQVASLREFDVSRMDQGVELIELARNASTLFKSMTPDEKRELVHLILSNPRIENGSMQYDLRKPFSTFRNVQNLEEWRGGRDSNPRPPP